MSKAHFTTLTLRFLQQKAQSIGHFLSIYFRWIVVSKFLLISFLLVGCAFSTPTVSQQKIRELSVLFQSMESTIPESEAMQLSKDIFHKTRQLTEEFEMTSPPLFHNFLVTVGLREKGLCYHWSDALYAHLIQKNYSSFEFHLVGANIGEYFYEHNALVVVGKDGKVEEGVVIDPWRNSGTLYFSRVKDDAAYRWVHRPKRGCH